MHPLDRTCLLWSLYGAVFFAVIIAFIVAGLLWLSTSRGNWTKLCWGIMMFGGGTLLLLWMGMDIGGKYFLRVAGSVFVPLAVVMVPLIFGSRKGKISAGAIKNLTQPWAGTRLERAAAAYLETAVRQGMPDTIAQDKLCDEGYSPAEVERVVQLRGAFVAHSGGLRERLHY